MVRTLDHLVLPWDTSGRRVIITSEVVTLCSGLGSGVMTPERLQSSYCLMVSPGTRDDFTCLWIFTINQAVLDPGVAQSHYVVKHTTGKYYRFH